MPATPITSLALDQQTVLVRCDFNVPLEAGRITDPTRIDASLETIRYILSHHGKAVLCSHLGRPKERTPDLSLKPVADYLSTVLDQKVLLAPDCIGEVTGRMIEGLAPGAAILLENLRFHPEEEANDRDFAHELARGKNVYVNDAFGTAHRAHASTVGVTQFIHDRAAGFLMLREIEALRAVTDNPAHPYVAILGGAKVTDKIGVMRSLMTKVDAILVGGAMAYAFLRARGQSVGLSKVEQEKAIKQSEEQVSPTATARELQALALKNNVALVLPIDHVVAATPDAEAPPEVVTEIPVDRMALDIGPRTVAEFIDQVSRAKTIVWNGPLGFFEVPAFAKGTLQVGEAIANLSGVTSVIGGGDTAAALAGQPWASKFTHISTGGGATLEYLEGIELPGVKALESN